MSKSVSIRKGTISNHTSFTGVLGEVTCVTDRSTIRIHDGSTAGGVELARNGYLVKSVAGGSNISLSEAEAARPFLEFTGILTGNIQVIFPITLNSGKLYLIKNSTTGSFTLTVIGTSGTGVVLPQSGVGLFSHDGTNMVSSGGVGSIGYFSDGTVSLPSISFSSDTDTGFYRSGANTLDVAVGGVRTATFTSNNNFLIGTTSETGLTGAGGLKINSSTAPTNTTTGSFVTAGGIGVGGRVYAGDFFNATKSSVGDFTALYLRNSDTTAGNTVSLNLNVFNSAAGLIISQSTNATGPSWAISSYDAFISTQQSGSMLHFGAGSASKQLTLSTTYFQILTATDSTSSSTGALLVTGGAAIAKTLTTAGRILSTSIKTTTYTITTSDSVIICNSSSAFTVSLPSLASASTGRQYIIKNKGAGQITLTASGSETIDGSVSVYINQYESLTIVSDGATWNVI